MPNLKFQPGDIIYNKDDRSYKFYVVMIAQKGDRLIGKWFDGSGEKLIPKDCYVLEGMNTGTNYLLGFDQEDIYELFKELYGNDEDEKKYSLKDKYPHKCPYCDAPAYLGGQNNIDCSKKCLEKKDKKGA